MLKTKAFIGSNVFMSRNLVPPEIFATLHDALNDNGAQIHLCCDPSRNGTNDYHIISSNKHDKFEDLKAKGCKLLGPRCVLSCAKECRPLPKQGFTCCLAMDGVKLLASGFDMDEKVKIEELVTEMGGVLHAKASLDLNFVIVKNVLAAKYKWALNTLKKPIVTYEWLKQCSDEHRVVPQESYKVLPFSGLTICVTGIPADKRREMEKLILQNGGKYSAELTKKCTHLISDAPEGDKYKVAKRWGHIHIVTSKWFDQSIVRRACLNEESYPVQNGSLSSHKVTRDSTVQHSQEKEISKLQSVASAAAADSNVTVISRTDCVDRDLEVTQSECMSPLSNFPVFVKEADAEVPPVKSSNELDFDGVVANDSESDDNDLYLSECRILLVGFETSEMRKLVNMVRKGGGSRSMSFNDKLTHIVIGCPSEMEKKDIRRLASLGVIYVVTTSWLEDCHRQKKEVPVLRRHIACDLFLPKASVKGAAVKSTMSTDQGKSSGFHQSLQTDHMVDIMDSGAVMPVSLEKSKEKPDMGINVLTASKALGRSVSKKELPVDKFKVPKRMKQDSSVKKVKSTTVFRGKIFCFSNLFPEERRAEIVQWISEGSGQVISEQANQNVHYTIECHGVTPKFIGNSQSIYISSHWIRSCLEAGSLLDVEGHILYSPLPCRVPLPGFESFRFCVSQYDEKDRILLRNLCFVLGAKFVEKLTKKVTHLLCRFTNGPKYEAACKWGVRSVTSEWILECVKKNAVVSVDQFLPKEVTDQDQEAGACITSQFPTQAARMISDMPSQFPSQSQDLRNIPNIYFSSEVDNHRTDSKISSIYSKKARLVEEHDLYDKVPFAVDSSIHVNNMNFFEDNVHKYVGEVSHAVPDVADAIEDLLEQTSKIHDQGSPVQAGCERSIYLSDCSALGEDNSNLHTVVGLSKNWLNSARQDDNGEASRDRRTGMYDGFSETQTESQVVSYEEDLSGRQMLIDRVRTRSSLQ
ncbi:PREDICTED: DNA topoisomerase 2-binding protein 1-A isoform X2 [Lupinus angustifolius]|uniref:DNA topoisomerase 2-binding protein 1-A isoform X2 n=1 Tax=Lupinus angustifolius TaxID=3871 RepID=UPI00092F89D5|nr:PREDICTED: DNA topoisomerase 2-binding protein 1-A isoform X2 [Lupinus angustifolius]